MTGFCECLDWARGGGHMLTDHHPNCSKYDPTIEAARIIKGLADAMREWGSWEDGIPEKFWPIYEEARNRIGEPIAPAGPKPGDAEP